MWPARFLVVKIHGYATFEALELADKGDSWHVTWCVTCSLKHVTTVRSWMPGAGEKKKKKMLKTKTTPSLPNWLLAASCEKIHRGMSGMTMYFSHILQINQWNLFSLSCAWRIDTSKPTSGLHKRGWLETCSAGFVPGKGWDSERS